MDDRYLNGSYMVANPEWGEGDAAWKAAQVASMIADHGLAPSSVCDIGCGTGGVLDHLQTLLPGPLTLVGYEPSSQAAQLAPAERRSRIELLDGGYASDSRRFDLLLCLDVAEHIEDYYGFLRDIRSKADLAIFHIPIDTAVSTVLLPQSLARSYHKVGHIQHFTPTTAIAALRHCGYEILDYRHTVPARAFSPTSTREAIGRFARLVGARLNVDLAAKFIAGFPLLVLARS